MARPCLCSLCVLCIARTQSSAACGTTTPPLGAPQLLPCWPGSQMPRQIPRVASSSTWLLLAQPSKVGPQAGQHCRRDQSEVALGCATSALRMLTDYEEDTPLKPSGSSVPSSSAALGAAAPVPNLRFPICLIGLIFAPRTHSSMVAWGSLWLWGPIVMERKCPFISHTRGL